MKEKRGKERNSTLSLRSTEIGPSVFIGARDKVHLLDESYTWAPKSRNFDTVPDSGFREVEGFRFRKCPRDFLEILLCLKK